MVKSLSNSTSAFPDLLGYKSSYNMFIKMYSPWSLGSIMEIGKKNHLAVNIQEDFREM